MKISKIAGSRDRWKKKAKLLGVKNRNAKKSQKRTRKRLLENSMDEDEIRRLKEELADVRSKLNIAVSQLESNPPVNHRTLCVFIVIYGIVSFRSVPRILSIFQEYLRDRIQVPHFTSVINWTLRVGVAIFNQVSIINGPWVALIDCSIDVGTRKALVVLRVPLNMLQNRKTAIGLEDCECIGLEISHKWNGTLISEALAKIFENIGLPIAIIKDGGTDLKKGVELFCEQNLQQNIFMIDDVGHFAANALKALFAKSKPFLQFLKILSTGSKRIRQTNLAWLLPPKIRTKGRFMSITAVAKWAQEVIDLIGGQGKAKEGADLGKARKAFAGLAKLRPFLKRFCSTCMIVEDFLKLLKTEGLNQSTYKSAKKILEKLSAKSLVRIRLSTWLEKHISIHRKMKIGDRCLMVSSDIIESLFGKFKTILQRNPQSELNRLLYVLPLLCGIHSRDDIDNALQKCSHSKMLQKIEETIPSTMRQQRVRELGKNSKSVPKSGVFQMKKAS